MVKPYVAPYPALTPQDEANLKQLEAWSLGLATDVEQAQNVQPPDDVPPPVAPGGLSQTSSVELNGQETLISTVFTWNAVEDATRYLVRLRRSAEVEYYQQFVSGTTVRLSGLLPGTDYVFQVATVDAWNRVSPWSTVLTFTTPGDTVPPVKVVGVVATPAVRSLIIRWDQVVVSDLRDYQVQVTTDPTFAAAPLLDRLTPANIIQFSPSSATTTDTTYYIRVRAIDRSGNTGEWSDSAQAVIGPGNAASQLAADEITAGTMNAAILLAGSLRTANTGRRVEIDSTGIRSYDAAGNSLVDISSVTEVFLFRTSVTGTRLEFTTNGLVVRRSDGTEAGKFDPTGLSFFPPDGQGDGTGLETIRWRRPGDANNFAGVYGYWDSTYSSGKGTTSCFVALRRAVSTHIVKFDVRGFNSAMTVMEWIFGADQDESYYWTSAGGYSYRFSKNLVPGDPATRSELWTPLRLRGPGLFYDNGVALATGAYTTINADINHTWLAPWPSGGPIPDVQTSLQDVGTVSGQMVWSWARSRSGVTLTVHNHERFRHSITDTASATVVAVPMVT